MRDSDRRVKLRRAVLSDLSSLERLESACFPEERQSSRRSIRESLQRRTQSVWVAETIGGEVIGAMVLFHHPRSLRIYSVAVAPGNRDLGVGQRFVRLAKALVARSRRERLSLEADIQNEALIAWYRRQGFRTAEELEDYYAPGESACRMVCESSRTRPEGTAT